jgi:hypothetical protein
VGEPPLLKGVKVEFNTAPRSKKNLTASEVDRFDDSSKPSARCDIELETSEAMAEVLKRAPDQSAGWKNSGNRLPEPWWRFAYLLFHRDSSLDELPAECDRIIRIFRKHILVMTHDPIRKNGARALALIDRKPEHAKLWQRTHL